MNTALEVVNIYSEHTAQDISNTFRIGINNLIARTEGNKTSKCILRENYEYYTGEFKEGNHSISYLCYYVSNHIYFKPHYRFELYLGFFV